MKYLQSVYDTQALNHWMKFWKCFYYHGSKHTKNSPKLAPSWSCFITQPNTDLWGTHQYTNNTQLSKPSSIKLLIINGNMSASSPSSPLFKYLDLTGMTVFYVLFSETEWVCKKHFMLAELSVTLTPFQIQYYLIVLSVQKEQKFHTPNFKLLSVILNASTI